MIPKLRFKADDGSEFPEWEEKEFGSIMSCYSGGTPSVKSPEYYNGNIPFMRSAEIHGNITELYLSELGLENSSAKMIHAGDLLYALYGATSGEVDISQIDAAINQAILCIVPYKDDRVYLMYWLLFNRMSIVSKLLQGGQGNLSAKLIKELMVPIPSFPEQKKIASFLSTIDDIITTTEAELTAWQERKKGVMQKIFSREVRFKADDGSEFPEWEEKKIGEICVINPKTEEVEDEFLYMDLGSVDHGDWEEPEVMIKSKAPSRAQRVARVGDVFFQSVRPYNQGHFHYSEKKDKQVVASTGYIQIRMKNCDSGFIYQILYDAHFNQEVSIRCTGSNYPAINADGFSEIVIAYPCVEEQKKIADCLSSLDDVINQIQAELSAWKEFKKGLLQQMFV